MVYIVMIGTHTVYSYDGIIWSVECIFISEDSAKKYIQEKQKIYGKSCEFEIEAHEVYA